MNFQGLDENMSIYVKPKSTEICNKWRFHPCMHTIWRTMEPHTPTEQRYPNARGNELHLDDSPAQVQTHHDYIGFRRDIEVVKQPRWIRWAHLMEREERAKLSRQLKSIIQEEMGEIVNEPRIRDEDNSLEKPELYDSQKRDFDITPNDADAAVAKICSTSDYLGHEQTIRAPCVNEDSLEMNEIAQKDDIGRINSSGDYSNGTNNDVTHRDVSHCIDYSDEHRVFIDGYLGEDGYSSNSDDNYTDFDDEHNFKDLNRTGNSSEKEENISVCYDLSDWDSLEKENNVDIEHADIDENEVTLCCDSSELSDDSCEEENTTVIDNYSDSTVMEETCRSECCVVESDKNEAILLKDEALDYPSAISTYEKEDNLSVNEKCQRLKKDLSKLKNCPAYNPKLTFFGRVINEPRIPVLEEEDCSDDIPCKMYMEIIDENKSSNNTKTSNNSDGMVLINQPLVSDEVLIIKDKPANKPNGDNYIMYRHIFNVAVFLFNTLYY